MNSTAKNYRKNGDEWVIGGKLRIEPGAVVNDEAGRLLPAVVFTYDYETEACTCDRSYEEVVEAAQNGVPIVLKHVQTSSYGGEYHNSETLTKVVFVNGPDENGNDTVLAVQALGLNETNVQYTYDGTLTAEIK